VDETPRRKRLDAEVARSAGWLEIFVELLAISLATVLVYSNTFEASFHLDDVPNIIRSTEAHSLLGPSPWSSRYLGYLSFALNYRLGGLKVVGFHVLNLLIHTGNALLVFWLTALTFRTPALRDSNATPLLRRFLPLAAGFLFAVHPIQTQAVTYIVQRFTSLATLFFLLSLALHAQARLALDEGTARRARVVWLFGLSFVAAVAAMKTKEISFTLPLVGAAYELLFFRRRRLALLAPLALAALLVPLAVAGQGGEKLSSVLANPVSFAAETLEIPRFVYLLTQTRVIVTYLRLLVVPVGQNLDHDFPLSHSLIEPRVLLAIAVLLALVTSAAFVLVRARKMKSAAGVLFFFGTIWFFLTLLVESSIIPIRDVIVEHRVYLPSVGAAVAFATAMLWALERLRIQRLPTVQATAALAIAAVPLGAATFSRNFVWRNDVTLWRDVAAKSPNRTRPHDILGSAYLDRGWMPEAISESLAALRISPEDVQALTNLGTAYLRLGRTDEAIAKLEKAVSLVRCRSSAQAHYSLGIAYSAKARFDDAIREYREAIRREPEAAGSHYVLGNAYLETGKLGDAAHEYREAIRLHPGHADAHNNLCGIAMKQGLFDEAIRECREASRLDPTMAEAHYNLAASYLKAGRPSEAVKEYRQGSALKPIPERSFELAAAAEAAAAETTSARR